MRQSYKTFFLWAVLILLFFSFYSIFSRQRSPEPKEIDASEFYAAVDRGDVSTTTVKGNVLQGQFKNRQEFRTVSPLDTQLLEKMRQKGVALKFEKEDSQSLWRSSSSPGCRSSSSASSSSSSCASSRAAAARR